MYSGMILPLLPVSILYGISTVFLPTCISKCAVINDLFLFKYIELILTVSISSSWESCATLTCNLCTVQSLLLLHTFCSGPSFCIWHTSSHMLGTVRAHVSHCNICIATCLKLHSVPVSPALLLFLRLC